MDMDGRRGGRVKKPGSRGTLTGPVRAHGGVHASRQGQRGSYKMSVRPTGACGARTHAPTMMVGPIGEAFAPPPRHAHPL
jgi:hypothetical protein